MKAYDRKIRNLLTCEEICINCKESFISKYSKGQFNNRDRMCGLCKRKNNHGIQYSDFTTGRQNTAKITLYR